MNTVLKILIFLLLIASIFMATHFAITKFRTQPDLLKAPDTLPTSSGHTDTTIEDRQHQRVKLGAQILNVELATTAQQKAQGLSGRSKLADNEGMLFDFSNEDTARPMFWMKDMLIDIDIIWIKDYTVVEITNNVPAPEPGTSENYLPRYQPGQDIDSVLEVRSGWAEQYNIKVGDTISY